MPSPQFMDAAGKAMMELFIARVCNLVAGVDINIFGVHLHPFDFLNSWATSLTADANNALHQAGIAVDNTIAQGAQIAALTASTTSTSTGGASISEPTFPASLTNSLGAGWTLGGNAGTAPWSTDPSGNAGLAANSSVPAGTRSALNTTVMATDDHQATAVVASTSGGADASTSLVVRCASDLSSFVYANVFSGKAYLGYGSYNPSSGVWTFHDWNTGGTAIGLAAGQTVTLAAGGTTYTLSINGTPVVAHTDASGQATVGAANRYVGLLSQQVYSGLLGILNIGWTVASFTAADTSSPAVVGTTWGVYRSSSSGANLPSGGGWQVLSTSIFDTIRQANNATVTSLGTGAVTVTKAGAYAVSAGFAYAVLASVSAGVAVGFWRTPSGSSTATMVRGCTAIQAPSSGGGGTISIAGSAVIYLNAGDTITPGVYDSGGSRQVVGAAIVGSPASGTGTYFDGALCA